MSCSQMDASAKLKTALAEGEEFEALNSQMRANQSALKEALAAEKQKTGEQAAEIADLREQVRAWDQSPDPNPDKHSNCITLQVHPCIQLIPPGLVPPVRRQCFGGHPVERLNLVVSKKLHIQF